MSERLDYVTPGEPFKPSAETWNSFVDAARTVRAKRVIFGVPALNEGGEEIERHFGKLTTDMAKGSFGAPVAFEMDVWEVNGASTASPKGWTRTTNTDLQGMTAYNLDCSKEALTGAFVKVERVGGIWTPYWVGVPCPCGSCTYDGAWSWDAFNIVCSGSTSTQNQVSDPQLRPCEEGNPDSPSWPDCAADGWVACQWYFAGNIATGGGGFVMDLVEIEDNTWRLKVASAIICNGHGCASDAIYEGGMVGCDGPLILFRVRHCDIGDDPVTEYLTPPTSCEFVPDGTVVTWPDSITLNREP